MFTQNSVWLATMQSDALVLGPDSGASEILFYFNNPMKMSLLKCTGIRVYKFDTLQKY
jgi:hypothetical protein